MDFVFESKANISLLISKLGIEQSADKYGQSVSINFRNQKNSSNCDGQWLGKL